jgi:HD superfamily phosphohydrolase YqeK
MSFPYFHISPLLNEAESAILNAAQSYLQVRDNERHTINAIEFALALLDGYQADRAIVVPAMTLHDVGWSAVAQDIISKASRPNPDKRLVRIHERAGVKIARAILDEVRYDHSCCAQILEIIDGHDTRNVALSTNDKIVKDSDKLTRYSKNFWFWTRNLPMPARELADTLEGMIDTWFFLDMSKEMARAELSKRRMEEHEPLW